VRFQFFASSLVFNGATYTGELAKSKKEAEQLAARAAIHSIMGNSDSETTMCQIIKCKFKLYARSSEVPFSNNAQNELILAAVNPGASLGFPLSNNEELEGTGCTYSMPTTTIPNACSGQVRTVPATFQTFHEFKRPKLVPSSEAITSPTLPSSEAIAPPIVFVPPVLDQALGVGSSSPMKKKKNRKNKKAKRKNLA